jgi:hypothetical protein
MLNLIGWLCWLAAAVIFFVIAFVTQTGTTDWTDIALGLFAAGFVLRAVPNVGTDP